MSKKLMCVISGKTTTVSDKYYEKKISEYGSEFDLTKLYTSREARTLLKRGYSVLDCRTMLKVEKKMPEITDEELFKIKSFIDDDTFLLNKSILTSSEDVKEYINILKEVYDFKG
jgi:hypothetical protein